MKKIISIILIVSLFLLSACSVSETETSEEGIQYAPVASSGVLSKVKSALSSSSSTTTIPSLNSKEKAILDNGDYLYETKYVVEGNKLNIYLYYNMQEFAQMEEFSQLTTKIQIQSDIAIQIQTEVDGAMQQMDELINQMMQGYDSFFTSAFDSSSDTSGNVYGVTYTETGEEYHLIADKDSDDDGTPNSQDDDIDNDGKSNDEDEDDDGDGENDEDDDWPNDDSRITAESESLILQIDTNGDGDEDDPGESDDDDGSGSGGDSDSLMYLETMDALIESITSQIETTQFVSYTVENNFKSGTSYLNTASTKSFKSVESQGEIAQGYIKNIKVVMVKTI